MNNCIVSWFRGALQKQAQPASTAPALEGLESRTLFAVAPHITTMITDNRAEVLLTTQVDLDAATVNTRSVQLYSVGVDGIPLTGDDVKQRIRVRWNAGNRRIMIKTFDFVADTTYWLKLSAKQILSTEGLKLDGEFNGAGLRSGNDVGGGDFLMVSKRDKSTRPTARFTTNYGGINVTLFKDLKPITVANFLHYSNEAAWDGTFFHRSVDNFVIQGGGFFVSAENEIDAVHQEAQIQNEPGTNNTRGRISMAKIGGQPNSATNQWFFNVKDNSADLDNNNGGFTAFGETNAAGLAVIDTINALELVNAGSPLNELPVNDRQAVIDREPPNGRLDPAADVVSIRRVAILNKVSALV